MAPSSLRITAAHHRPILIPPCPLFPPFHPQTRSIPAIMSGGDYILASHTGSGKTLAYLLPIVSMTFTS